MTTDVILIQPSRCLIQKTFLPEKDAYIDMHMKLDCNILDSVHICIGKKFAVLFVDDNGLLFDIESGGNPNGYFRIGDSQLFAGNGLLMDIDPETGEEMPATLNLLELAQHVRFYTLQEALASGLSIEPRAEFLRL